MVFEDNQTTNREIGLNESEILERMRYLGDRACTGPVFRPDRGIYSVNGYYSTFEFKRAVEHPEN